MKMAERVENGRIGPAGDAIARQKDGREKNRPAPGAPPNARLNPQAADHLPEVSTELQTIPVRKETILIVDDEIGLRELVGDILRQQRYRVLVASTGVDALNIWERHRGRIDLLLTDVIMPGGLTGGALAAELKRRKPGLKIIFTSGYCPELIGKDLLSGGVAFLPKPYQSPQLAQIVRQCLDGTLKVKTQRTPVLDDEASMSTPASAAA